MIKHTLLLIILIVFLSVFSGCSGGGGNPITPSDPTPDPTLNLPDPDESQSNRALFGAWTAECYPGSVTAVVHPNGKYNTNYNVTNSIETPLVSINSFDTQTGIVDVDVTIINSYDSDAYDARIIVYADIENYTLTDSNQFTPLWTDQDTDPINPFKAFACDEPNRIFSSKAAHTTNMQFSITNGHADINFAVDASIDGNCLEPYAIQNFTITPLNENVGSKAMVSLEVLDWQNDVSKVDMYCPEISGENLLQFQSSDMKNWQLFLTNEIGAYPGEYDATVIAYSANSGDISLISKQKIIVDTGNPGIPDNPEIIWSHNEIWDCFAVFAKDDLVYVSDREAGFKIFDASDPANLVLLSSTPLLDDNGRLLDMEDLMVFGNRAYIVTDDDDYIIIYDVSDPRNPFELGRIHGSRIVDFDLYGDVICLATKRAYTAFFSASDPTNITEIKNLALSGKARGVDVVGDYAYYATYSGLEIVDINPIEHANVVSLTTTEQKALDVIVDGKYAYLGMANEGLKIFDISDPTAPILISSLVLPWDAEEVEVSDGFVYIREGGSNLKIVDVRNPAKPVWIQNIPEFISQDISIIGNYAYMASGKRGLNSYDLSNPAAPVNIGTVKSFAPLKVIVDGDYAYYLQHGSINGEFTNGWLGVFDISNINNPIKRGSVPIQSAIDFAVRDNFAYVVTARKGTYVIDVKNPDFPEVVQFIENSFDSTDIKLADNYAVLPFNNGLHIFDITDPIAPFFVRDIFVAGAGEVEIVNDRIYVGSYNGSGFTVIDASDITKPSIIGHVDCQDTNGIAIKGNYAFLAADIAGFIVIDITDPYNPVLVANIPDFTGNDIEIADAYAYVPFGGIFDCMHIIDISNPLEPEIFNTVFTNYPSYSVALYDNYAFLAEGLGGLKLIKLW